MYTFHLLKIKFLKLESFSTIVTSSNPKKEFIDRDDRIIKVQHQKRMSKHVNDDIENSLWVVESTALRERSLGIFFGIFQWPSSEDMAEKEIF